MSMREEYPACADLVDQARKEFGEVKVLYIKDLESGREWGNKDERPWVDAGLVVSAQWWNENARKRRRR